MSVRRSIGNALLWTSGILTCLWVAFFARYEFQDGGVFMVPGLFGGGLVMFLGAWLRFGGPPEGTPASREDSGT